MFSDYYIYEHWRPDTNQCFYVGKGRRDRAFRRYSRNKRWHNVVNKLDRQGLSYTVVMVEKALTNDQASQMEIERIAYWKSQSNALVNATDGGGGAAGYTHSEEVKRALTELNKNRSPEVRAKIGAANSKRTVSDATRARLSLLARNMSPETRAKLSDAARGRKHSLEARVKISEANRNRSDETRAKTADALRGRRIPEAVKLKISAALRGRKLSPEHCANIAEVAKISQLGKVLSEATKEKLRNPSFETRAKLSASAKTQWERRRGCYVA